MNWFEFIIAFLGIVVLFILGLAFIAGKYNMLDKDKKKK